VQVAVAFTLAYPYGSPQILSSYAYNSHGQGAPRAAVHREDGSLGCGERDAWYCQHRWPEISGMVKPTTRAECFCYFAAVVLEHWEIQQTVQKMLALYIRNSCVLHQHFCISLSHLFVRIARVTFNMNCHKRTSRTVQGSDTRVAICRLHGGNRLEIASSHTGG